MQIRAIDMQPYRPWPLRLMNGYGRWLNRLGIEPVKLDSDHLIAEAVKRAGSSDFGDEGYRAGLDRLVAALNTDARLNLLGRLMAREEIVHRLATRLCVLAWRHQHPEVADEKVHTPLFIVGLPRTGTTILHALLALDPAHRSPLFWEVEQPVPPSTPASWAIDPRIDQVKRKLALFNKLCPGIQAVHVMEAELQQECVAILAMDLRAEQFFTLYDVPGYAEWLIDEPRAWALHFHRQMLQHLQSGGVRCSRWLLKSPCHLHRLNELLVGISGRAHHPYPS
jgi:hypothetical protein